MKAIAITSMGLGGNMIKAAYHSDKQMVVDVLLRDVMSQQILIGQELKVGATTIALSENFVFSFSNVAWTVEAKSNQLPYASKNTNKKRLDVKIVTTSNVDSDPVAPHGLIGQHYDRDGKKVIGSLDDYTHGKVIETAVNGEGAIEGVAADYTIDRANPFSTKFKYSRFGLTHAEPRDVSLLTGKIFKKSGDLIAGATNDEGDESR